MPCVPIGMPSIYRAATREAAVPVNVKARILNTLAGSRLSWRRSVSCPAPPSAIATEHRCQPPIPALHAENCSQLKADKSQSNPADGKGQWYAGRDRNNKPGHLTARGNRSCSAPLTVAGRLDEEFQGHANSCRSGSGPFGACALPDVFELWWPSVFTPVLGRCASREAASSALQTCSFG